ncbi:MAG: M48 family metallopeptidase [Pirellulaceae bacterium]
MPIQVKCPACAVTLKVSEKLAGKQGKCPKCAARVTIPGVDSVEPLAPQGRMATAATLAPPPVEQPPRTTPPLRAGQPAGPVAPQIKQPDPQRVQQRIDQLFQGEIKPVRTTLGYKVGILLVTGVMIALPLIYLTFVGLVAYGVLYHANYHVGMLSYGHGRGAIFVFLAYLAPMVIGPISILFMIKPIFARPGRQITGRSLTPQGEPILFAFVERLCQIVGAPMPSRIDVDYDLNASASFRRGMLSFFGSDLVLTIGIPLAAGLSLRQFTGVLAHEFGHFSQGVGMRLTYVARSINAWFARVVYERDEWDEFLEETASEIDIRIGWILLLCQLFIGISRGLLWILMMIGHGISGYMLRQMEYDADRYEARVAGSETFAETSLRMRELAAAYGATQLTIINNIERGTFPDNLPALLLQQADKLPAQTKMEIRNSVAKDKTGLFDSHPADKDRIASAKKEATPGIFDSTAPAKSLFRDFEALSKNVTWDIYRAMGTDVKPQDMTPISKLTGPEPTYDSRGRANYDNSPLPLD